MPKIEINESLFFKILGRTYTYDELEEILTSAKAELDEIPDKNLKTEDRTLKIELNDTNRPDLWSTAGLSRLLRIHAGGKSSFNEYEKFLSSAKVEKTCGNRVIKVDPNIKNIRPFAAGFAVNGKKINSYMLQEIIQTQEKLCRNFGRKRKSVSMGVYRANLINWPVHYKAADPDKTEFIPLDGEKPISCRKILKTQPKGIEYGPIIENEKLFPILEDSKGEILSMPPIINSANIGAVKVGDDELFVEFTGTDLISILLSVNIAACDFSDLGFSILPVRTEYSYETQFGKTITAPYYFQEQTKTSVNSVNKLLGSSLSVKEISDALTKMDCKTFISKEEITVLPPPYRNDFLHEADIIEDVMMGKTVNFFDPETPNEFTIGRLSPSTMISRKIRGLMIGMGYQEMIFNYLGSKKDLIENMCITGNDVIEIANPMSENYQFVRSSIIPSLLNAEATSASAVYPHKIFETGKTAFLCGEENTGTRTIQSLGFLTACQNANFNDAASETANLLYYLGIEYKVCETFDPRFIKGRQAGLMLNNKQIGIFGEVAPEVLSNWNIEIPCYAGELNLQMLIKEI